MPDPAPQHVVIVGAGLAGSLLACLFGRRGWRVDLVERRSDPRAAGFVGGRSINLALSTRGITALARAGLDRRVLDEAIPMRGRMMHDGAGQLSFQAYSAKDDEVINSVSRGGLNLTLLNAAEAYDSVTVRFAHRCLDVDLETTTIMLETPEGDTHAIAADLIVGADGAFSAVRDRLQRSGGFDFQQQYLTHGYKELTIPPAADGSFALDENALHIWPRGGEMMIALPNQDRTFTATLFWPSGAFAALDTEAKIMERFRRDYPDAVPLMPGLVDDYQRNPVGSLVTVRCSPWSEGRVVLLGDAAHAIVPFYGQGMNAAFEDVRILDELVDEYGPDWGRVLPAFGSARIPNANAIADLALYNFIEMRDHVGSALFRLQKRLGNLANRLMPMKWQSLYHMVTFSNRPYAEAQAVAFGRVRKLRTALGVAGVAALVLAAFVVGMLL